MQHQLGSDADGQSLIIRKSRASRHVEGLEGHKAGLRVLLLLAQFLQTTDKSVEASFAEIISREIHRLHRLGGMRENELEDDGGGGRVADFVVGDVEGDEAIRWQRAETFDEVDATRRRDVVAR